MDIKIMEKEPSSNECHHIRGLYHRNELSLTDRISYRWVFYPLDTHLLSTHFYSTSTCGLRVPAGSSLLSPSVHRPLTPVPQAFLGSTCEHTTRSPPADFHLSSVPFSAAFVTAGDSLPGAGAPGFFLSEPPPNKSSSLPGDPSPSLSP